MAAVYPGAVKSYTDKVNGTSIVDAADINSVQAEVNAIETELGAAPRTSTIGVSSVTYSSTGPNSTVADRIKNLEGGITAGASDGSRIGYTQLDQKTLTASGAGGSVSFTSISASYQKLVIQIDFTAVTTGTALSATLNGLTTNTYNYGRVQYVTGTTTYTAGSPSTAFDLGTISTVNNQCVIEIPNYSRSTAGKVFTALFGTLSLTGFQSTATAVNRVDVILASAGNATATITLYGVK